MDKRPPEFRGDEEEYEPQTDPESCEALVVPTVSQLELLPSPQKKSYATDSPGTLQVEPPVV
ncbi:MAG: hypothetical protein WB579_25405 [Bryobacteraceae bacterium]